MRIRFTNTVDDMVIWLQHHHANSPTVRKQKQFYIWFFIIVVGVPSLMLAMWQIVMINSIGWLPLVGLFGTLVAVVSCSPIFKHNVKATTRKMIAEGSNRGLVGEHVLEIETDGLVERNYYGELKSYWRGIDRIVCVDGFVFIYLTSVTAHIIPVSSITEGDWKVFVAALQEQLGNTPPSGPPPSLRPSHTVTTHANK